ncbi:MAG: outer membrane beta-barrel protein [Hyphomicrobiales bacterium]|nr:outer membrane beta-barrel protein [Alphaproteobacteria bacterium]
MQERFTWTGFYIGGHAGYAWSTVKGHGTVASGSADLDGWLAGGQIGFNWQAGDWVFGLQGDYSYADIRETLTGAAVLGAGSSVTVKQDYVATATGRIGYAFDRVLVYGKGGVAFTRDKWNAANATGGTGTGNFSRTGWVAGAGIEWAFAGNWSVFAEYNYLSFGNKNETLVAAGTFPVVPAASVSSTINLVKTGINYRF